MITDLFCSRELLCFYVYVISVVAGGVACIIDFEQPHLGALQQCVPVSSEDKVGPVMLTETQVLRLLSITLPLFILMMYI
jgi:hypothetical protein